MRSNLATLPGASPSGPGVSLMGAFQKASQEGVNLYMVEILFRSRILGSVPKHDAVVEAWIENSLAKGVEKAIKGGAEPPTEDQIAAFHARQAQEARVKSVDQAIDEETLKRSVGFYSDEEGGIYLPTYAPKAMLREVLSSLGVFVAKRGAKQTLQHLANVVALDAAGQVASGPASERLYFFRRGGDLFPFTEDNPKGGKVPGLPAAEFPVTRPDGIIQRAIHAQTPQGPRSALVLCDYVERARLRFGITVAARLQSNRDGAALTDDMIAEALVHAQSDGLGGTRSMLFGAFDVVDFRRLTDNPYTVGKAAAAGDAGGDGAAAGAAGEGGEAPAKRKPGRPRKA